MAGPLTSVEARFALLGGSMRMLEDMNPEERVIFIEQAMLALSGMPEHTFALIAIPDANVLETGQDWSSESGILPGDFRTDSNKKITWGGRA